MLTLRDIMVNGIPDMEPVNKPYKLDRPTCPCCGNSYPSILYKTDYGDILGCEECVVVECLLQEPDED